MSDCQITPVKSGFNTVRLPLGKTGLFRVNPRATLGCISFTILIRKSEKQWKVLSVCQENLPTRGPTGNQTFLQAVPLSKIWLPTGPPRGKFLQTTLRIFHCLYKFKVSWKVMNFRQWRQNLNKSPGIYFLFSKIDLCFIFKYISNLFTQARFNQNLNASIMSLMNWNALPALRWCISPAEPATVLLQKIQKCLLKVIKNWTRSISKPFFVGKCLEDPV